MVVGITKINRGFVLLFVAVTRGVYVCATSTATESAAAAAATMMLLKSEQDQTESLLGTSSQDLWIEELRRI